MDINEMPLLNSDEILCGITVEELIDTARCNGESIKSAYRRILAINLEDAEFMLDKLENQLDSKNKDAYIKD